MKTNPSDASKETLERLSLAQRMLTAKKRRQEQVHQYLMREKFDMHQNAKDASETGVIAAKKRQNSCAKVTFDPTSRLFEAVVRKDLSDVSQLLKSGVCDKNATNSYGFTPIHQSCIDQNLSMIRLLVKDFDVDVNKCDLEKWTPLHTVALFGFADIAKFLLNNGADVMALNIDMNMPYDLCDEENTLDAIEAHMASKEVTQEKIEMMRKVGERKMLKELQQHFSSGRFNGFKFVGNNGESLLHIASANGYYEVASFLINKLKHEVSCFDNDLWQPIHAAAYWQQVKVLELLMSKGADIYAKNNDGEDALSLCRDKEFADWLWQTYSDTNHKHKKNSNSFTNSMKNTMKKTGSSRHHFNSSVSLNDLTNLSSKRLNTERKEKKQKKDKANEYQWLISSGDNLDEDDDDYNPRDYNNNNNRTRNLNSLQNPSPTIEKASMMNANRKFSEAQQDSDRKHSLKNPNGEKRANSIDNNHLSVNYKCHSNSNDTSEQSMGWKAAIRQMDDKHKGDARKNSDQSVVSNPSKASRNDAKNLAVKRIKNIKPSSMGFEEESTDKYMSNNINENKSKRSASMGEVKLLRTTLSDPGKRSLKKMPTGISTEKNTKHQNSRKCTIS